MGLHPGEYQKMTWREYVLMWRAFNKKRTLEFEHTRAICYYAVAPYMKNKMPIQKFWPLETDGEKNEDRAEEMKRLLEVAKQRTAERRNKNKAK